VIPAVEDEAMAREPAFFQRGMALIRRRRKYFFAAIIGYMPLMWAVNKISPTFRSMAITFGVWVVILFITALCSAIVRCPRCGNYFHMHGMSLMYLRRCLHCQLHITANGDDEAQ
jgi:hypothetical protein